MHKVEAGKKYRILTVKIAVLESIPSAEVTDKISALLSENGVCSDDNIIADWTYTTNDDSYEINDCPVFEAPNDCEEGEIFMMESY